MSQELLEKWENIMKQKKSEMPAGSGLAILKNFDSVGRGRD